MRESTRRKLNQVYKAVDWCLVMVCYILALINIFTDRLDLGLLWLILARVMPTRSR